MECDFEMNKQDTSKSVEDVVNVPTEGDAHNAMNSFSYIAAQYLEMMNNDKDLEEAINQDETTIRKFIVYHGAK